MRAAVVIRKSADGRDWVVLYVMDNGDVVFGERRSSREAIVEEAL